MNSIPARIFALFCTAAAIAACGSSSSADATATGTIGGTAFVFGSAEAAAGGTAAANTGPTVAVAISSNAKATCSGGIVGDPAGMASTTLFTFQVVQGGNAITTGTYSVLATDPAPRVLAWSIINDATCNDTGRGVTAGTVTLSTLTATSVSGSYNLSWANGDTVSGTFNLPLCSLTTVATDAGQACR